MFRVILRSGLTVRDYILRWIQLNLDDLVTIQRDTLIAGDLNFHVNNKSDVDGGRFRSILWVEAARHWFDTHKHGHSLDELTSRE